MPGYLERYNNGEHVAVWDELLSRGEEVMTEPLYSEAWAVCYHTMSRLKENIEMLIDKLEDTGFQFGTYPDHTKFHHYEGPLTRAPGDLKSKLEFVQSAGSPPLVIPLSVRAFWQEIGSVNLVGCH